MHNVVVRKAVLQDAAEIANVHINSWREAYNGLFPKVFLDERPLFFKNRFELWKNVTVRSDQLTLVAESEEHGVVGFINGSNGRDKGREDQLEVFCIYLLEKYHDKKIGLNLLKSFFDLQKNKGFSKAYLWVLEDNPTISFYVKSGAVHTGDKKQDHVAGQLVNELCYEWDKI